MKQKVFREERLQSIADRVLAGSRVYVEELAREFSVSPSSIRIDLAELETRGLLTRTHGGAILSEKVDGHVITQKSSLEMRRRLHLAEKDAIGRAAAALIDEGDTLMMDGGSTTLYVARHLAAKRNLTVITNAVSLLPDLMTLPDVQIYVTGGLLDLSFATLLGDLAIDGLSHFRTAKAILGIDGISVGSGLSVTNAFVAATKRKMIAASEQVIVVSDHTKLDQVCLIPLAPLSDMDYLVTDDGATTESVEAIRRCGARVILARAEQAAPAET